MLGVRGSAARDGLILAEAERFAPRGYVRQPSFSRTKRYGGMIAYRPFRTATPRCPACPPDGARSL